MEVIGQACRNGCVYGQAVYTIVLRVQKNTYDGQAHPKYVRIGAWEREAQNQLPPSNQGSARERHMIRPR